MRRHWKSARKALALLLALVLVAGLFVGCKEDESKPSATKTPTATPSGSTPKPNVQITYDATQFDIVGTTLVEYIGDGGAVVIPNQVTVIGTNAFAGCTNVTSIEFPKSVREIEAYAFDGCTGLTGVLSYKDNSFPNNLNYLGEAAFRGCTGITEVHIPNKIYKMGTQVFDGCTALVKATLPDQFLETNSDTYLPEYTFRGCTSLTEVVVPSKAIRFDDGSFEGCSSLESIALPDKLEILGKEVFAGCTKLANITFSKSLYQIGQGSLSDTAYYKTALEEAGKKEDDADRYVMIGRSTIIAYVPATTGDVSLNIPDKAYAICDGAFDSFINRLVAVEFSASGKMAKFGNNIFKNATKLQSIELPSKIQVIPDGLFDGCVNLKQVNTTKNRLTYIGAYAFNQCSSLEEIFLPDAITTIGDYAFYGCTSLKTILFPSDIVTIGDYAFKNCTGISEFTFTLNLADVGVQAFDNTIWYNNLSNYDTKPTKNQFHIFGDGVLIKADIFENTIVIPEEVKSIAAFTFKGWTQIGDREFYGSKLPKSITIPAGVTRIGDYAFFCCENLETVFIANTVTSIGEKAFYGCTKITSIVIPSSVTSIKDYCFYGCSALEEVVLPSSLTSIGDYAFYNCFALKDITIPASVSKIGNYAFSGTAWYTYNSQDFFVVNNILLKCSSSDEKVTIPANVIAICGGAFENEYIKDVTVPASITKITEYAFSGCASMTNIHFNGTISAIESRAFNGCKALKITVPAGATVAEDAFANCPLMNG